MPAHPKDVEPTEAKAPKGAVYQVAPGHGIAPFGNDVSSVGEFGQEAKIYHGGDTVTLGSALAKHYVALGALVPFIPDDEDR